jgi:hypothetical protein
MANTTVQPGATAAPKSLPARFVGVISAPRPTFEAIVASPKWLGMLALTTVLVAFFTTLPMATEAGREAALETQVRQMESFGVDVNDEMYEQMRARSGMALYTTPIGILIVSPIVALIIAGILFAIFNAAMGGTAAFKQVFTVLVHAGAVSALGSVFTGVLNYFRGAMTSATNLSVLLPMLPEGSFIGRLAGMVDVFMIWWLITLSIGLAVLYKRRTQPIAITLFSIYAVIALVAAAVMSRLGGGAN